MPEKITDEQLLEKAKGGDEAAFLMLYQRYRDAIFRFAYRLLGSVEMAEDVAHDCFLSLLKQPQRFDPARGARLRTYLYAAARNLALKRLRYFDREQVVDELPEEPLRKLLDAELAAEVGRAVASLPPLQREALVLFEYEELALSEIAAVVGADVGTVKGRLHRARERLRRRLAPYLQGDRESMTVEKT